MSKIPKRRSKAKHKTTKIILTPEYDTPEKRKRIEEICKRYGTTAIFELETRYKMKMIQGPAYILEEARKSRATKPRKAKT